MLNSLFTGAAESLQSEDEVDVKPNVAQLERKQRAATLQEDIKRLTEHAEVKKELISKLKQKIAEEETRVAEKKEKVRLLAADVTFQQRKLFTAQCALLSAQETLEKKKQQALLSPFNDGWLVDDPQDVPDIQPQADKATLLKIVTSDFHNYSLNLSHLKQHDDSSLSKLYEQQISVRDKYALHVTELSEKISHVTADLSVIRRHVEDLNARMAVLNSASATVTPAPGSSVLSRTVSRRSNATASLIDRSSSPSFSFTDLSRDRSLSAPLRSHGALDDDGDDCDATASFTVIARSAAGNSRPFELHPSLSSRPHPPRPLNQHEIFGLPPVAPVSSFASLQSMSHRLRSLPQDTQSKYIIHGFDRKGISTTLLVPQTRQEELLLSNSDAKRRVRAVFPLCCIHEMMLISFRSVPCGLWRATQCCPFVERLHNRSRFWQLDCEA